MAHGHPDAWGYPIGHLWQEASIVIERIDGERAMTAQMFQLAISAIPSLGITPESTKDAQKRFADAVRQAIGEP